MFSAGSNCSRQIKLNRGISGNQPHGFTLVELLVVIAIIALLLAILMPSLKKARRQAQTVICTSYTKQVGLSALTYALENNDFAPPSHSWQYLNAHSRLADLFPAANLKFPWQYYLWPYHKDWSIYRCPANPESYAVVWKSSPLVFFWYSVPVFGNPRNNGECPDRLPSNFGYNNFVGGSRARGHTNSPYTYEPLRLSSVRSDTGLFADTYQPDPGYRSQLFSGIYIYDESLGSCNVDFRHGARSRETPEADSGSLVGLDLRYGSRANVVFADGSGRLVAPGKAFWYYGGNYKKTIWWSSNAMGR